MKITLPAKIAGHLRTLLAALRSDEYRQTCHALRKKNTPDEGYCYCIEGVMMDLYETQTSIKLDWHEQYAPGKVNKYFFDSYYTPDLVRWSSFSGRSCVTTLVELNDTYHLPFAQIAEEIEKKYAL
jgi:hypothetical protein